MHQHKEQTLHLDREKHRSTTFSPYRQADIRKLYGGRCTFCGEPLDPGVAFCTECGNAVEGITCPRCGTVSHRSFCSNCNYPLNEQAQEAVAEAKADPHFRRAEQLAREMAELEAVIEEGRKAMKATGQPGATATGPYESCTLSDSNRRVLAAYSELFTDATAPTVNPIPAPPVNPAPASAAEPAAATHREQFSLSKLQDAVAAYKAKAAELQRQMDAMMPPSAATPEEKRNFFSARKITSVQLRMEVQGWVCNYCGCTHRQPSECMEPQLGGKWIFKEVEALTDTYLID